MKQKICVFLTAIILGLTTFSYAQASDSTIEIVVPTPPGGAIDITARAISKHLTNNKINNVVTYYPGAGGEIAVRRTHEKLNNVIMVASSANFVFHDVSLDRENQITRTMQLIGPSTINPMFFVVGPNSEFKSLKELIAYSQKQELPCAASNAHGEVILKQMNKQYHTKFLPVMYKGTGQLIPDVLGGHVKCAFDQTAPYMSLGNKIQWLGTSTSKQIKADVPTIGSVLPKFQFETWYGVAIPKHSNIASDPQLINLLSTWNQDRALVQTLEDRGFITVTPSSNLNNRAIKETDFYRNLLK